MPSVDSRSVASVYRASTLKSALATVPGWVKFTVRSRVATQLVSVSVGFCTASGHSAQTYVAPNFGSCMALIVAPSACHVLPRTFWYGVSSVSDIGSHTRVTPAGCKMSTCVVTSNPRHFSAMPGAARVKRGSADIIAIVERAQLAFKNARRCTGISSLTTLYAIGSDDDEHFSY